MEEELYHIRMMNNSHGFYNKEIKSFNINEGLECEKEDDEFVEAV